MAQSQTELNNADWWTLLPKESMENFLREDLAKNIASKLEELENENKVELYCEGCDSFFECEPQLAKIMLEDKSDPDTCHELILCNDCTLEAMIEEQWEDEEWVDE